MGIIFDTHLVYGVSPNQNDFLERQECTPIFTALHRYLYVVGEVGEEVKTCPLLHLIDRYGVVGVDVGVGLILEPETYCRCRCYRATAVGLHLQRYFVEVVWYRYLLGVVGCLNVGYRLCLAHLRESHTRYDVDCLACCLALQCAFEVAPHSAVEAILHLRYRVGNVESLLLHLLVSVARGVRNKVSARVCVALVGVVAEVYLLTFVDKWVVVPLRRAIERTHMARLERICHPHRGVGRVVVIGGVVTLATRIDLQLLCIRIERTIANRRQFEPTLAWHSRWYGRCQRCSCRCYSGAVCCGARSVDRVGRSRLQLHVAHLRVSLCCAYVVGCRCRVRRACEVERYNSVSYILRALHHATRRRQSAVKRSRYVS